MSLYFCWVSETKVSGESVELASATLMKVVSGNIWTFSLLFLPPSDPGGQDNASAAVWSLPGMCSMVKW